MIAALLAAALWAVQPDLDAALLACADEPDAERLACYDRALARVGADRPAPAPLTPEDVAEQAEAARRGAPVRAPGAASRAAPLPDEPTARAPTRPVATGGGAATGASGLPQDEPITAIDFDAYDVARVTLANGQVWQQLSADGVVLRPTRRQADAGLRASVRRGALGSHRMTVEPVGRTIRVRRAQ